MSKSYNSLIVGCLDKPVAAFREPSVRGNLGRFPKAGFRGRFAVVREEIAAICLSGMEHMKILAERVCHGFVEVGRRVMLVTGRSIATKEVQVGTIELCEPDWIVR